jgi:hypothetical protein
MSSSPQTFRNTTAIGLRAAEYAGTPFLSGMNNGSCQPGIGIALASGEDMTDSWSLLDQDGDIRVPQHSAVIGNVGYTDPADYPSSGGTEGNGKAQAQYVIGVINPTLAAVEADPNVGGTITVDGTANLQTLAAGWVKTAV